MFLTSVEQPMRVEWIPVNLIDPEFMLEDKQNLDVFVGYTTLPIFNLDYFYCPIIRSCSNSQSLIEFVQLIGFNFTNKSGMQLFIKKSLKFVINNF